MCDAPPNFLKDSNVSPNMKAMEEEGVWIRPLTCSTWCEKVVLELWDGD
jgi:hypothetical protein